MGILSAIPKGIVIAMQIALAALLVLTVVPLAIGGLDVSDIEAEPPEYKKGLITFNASATVNANLFFDITDFGYSISVVSGDERITLSEEPGITISKKGTTDINIPIEIPLTTVMMLILLGAATEDQDTRMELIVHGSTMGGMISASAQMDLWVPTVTNVDDTVVLTTDGKDIESLAFDLRADVLSEILKAIPDSVTIEVGGTVITFLRPIPGDDTYFTIDWKIDGSVPDPADGLIESVERAIADGGADGIDVHIPGLIDPIHLTKEQAQFIVEVLKIILGMNS